MAEQAVADWHPEDIKAAVRKRGATLADVARQAGLGSAALRLALTVPREQAEAAIAAFLGLPPVAIWPSRYHHTGERKRPQPVNNYRTERRFGNPPRSAGRRLSRSGAAAQC